MSSHACLDLLPTELKTRIADECYRWDATRKEARQLVSDKDSEARKYPSAVGMLFQVSREWSAIAASFRFRSLRAEQCADPTFQLMLRPKYGHHLKVLDLVDVPGDAISGLFTFLASFTGTLEHLKVMTTVFSLTLNLLRHLPQSADRTFVTRSYTEDTLRRLIRVSETVSLALPAFEMLDLCIGSSIKRLSLVCALDQPSKIAHLVEVIASCSALVGLDLEQAATHGKDLTSFMAVLPSPGQMPPVQRLRLDTFVGSASFRFLIDLFAPTLVHVELELSIRSHRMNEGFGTWPLDVARRYPRLATVWVRDRTDAPFPFLPSLSPAAFPSLRRLVWDLSLVSSETIKASLAAQLQPLATSFTNSVSPLQVDIFAMPVDLDDVRAAVPTSIPTCMRLTVGIDPDKSEASEHPARFFRHPSMIENPDEPLEVAQEAIRDSLQAIESMADFAVATGDRTQLAKIGEALQECEWMRYNLRSG